MKLRRTTICVLVATGSLLRGGEDDNPSFDFRHDIAPHLARAGCAAADCHGGATGRGGFKLSLFATNARADYEAITQDLEARRIDYTDPERSLVLRKPTRQIKHKGGKVIGADSEAYRALRAWIVNGAPFEQGESRSLIGLSLDRASDRLEVTATFESPEGSRQSRDVTSLARFESTDESVASVDEDGRITLHGAGEAWILARYRSLTARHAVRQPFASRRDPPATAHPLDEIWNARLGQLGLDAAPPAAPHRLLRRLYLDVCGRAPAPDEISAFFELPEESRIETTADALMQGEEFAEQWARHLWSWLEIPLPSEDLRHTSERNRRLRESTREFAASDASLLEFATDTFRQADRREFVNRFADPRDRAEFTGRAFLGISIGCARCHNHPMDRWSQAQHLQFSAFFTDHRPVPGRPGMSAPGMFFLPGDGKPVEPALLPIAAAFPPAPGPGDRSEQLARFLRTSASGAIARNAANRIFGILMGRHLVAAPDDHRLSNPAVHEPILDLLSAHFRENDYRIRPLVRLIITSQLYALSSEPPDRAATNGDPTLRYLARREARPMAGDEFLRAVRAVLGIKEPRPSEIPETPLAQQLYLLNSGVLQEWLQRPGNQVDAIFAFETDPARQLEQLYLLTLTRPPRPLERAEFLPMLDKADDPRLAGRDLAYALLASREFSSIR